MASDSKQKLLLKTLFLTTLLITIVYASLMPHVQASETAIQQEVLSVTGNVIDIDLTKYAPASEYKQDSYMDVLPQENLRYTLETEESTLDLYYTFVSGKLQKIHVLECQGSPRTHKTTAANSLEMAKDFLSSYQDHSENAFYEELRTTLADVDENENLTATFGNTKLSVTAQEGSATFRWTYVFNGVEAPDKCVALHYEDGFLKYFIDNWDLYKIGSTSVNLSEQEAIDVAMSQAKAFTWSTVLDNETVKGLRYNVTNAMVWTTVFVNSLYMDNPRGEDPLMLYPMRHIWVSFDKFYPCNVYGMNVYVWADTGEIGHMQERFSTMDPPADLVATAEDISALATGSQAVAVDEEQSGSVPVALMALPAFAALMVGAVFLYLGKKRSLVCMNRRSLKGLILCFLITLTVFFAVLAPPTVSAVNLNGRATIWGSESIGAWNSSISPNGASWRKHPDEVTQQQYTADFIRDEFGQNGYYASDYQGDDGSDKNSILNQIQVNGQNFPRVAVVDFDHGNGKSNTTLEGVPIDEFHFMFEDNTGTIIGGQSPGTNVSSNGVYDLEIYPRTGSENYFFVLINACNSACLNETWNGEPCYQGLIGGRARGMPYAWTHRMVHPTATSTPPYGNISRNGYTHPDSNSFVYLGFDGGSAALSQDVEGLEEPCEYRLWLEHFFSYALRNDWSVNDALDEASQYFYDGDFDQIPLYTGFDAIWPMYYNEQWNNGTGTGYLRVYGNGNVKLYQPKIDLVARNYSTGSPLGGNPTTIEGQSFGAYAYVVPKGYAIYATDPTGYQFSHYAYKGSNYTNRQSTILLDADGELTTYYTQVSYIIIESASGGTTTPSAGYYTGSGSMQIQANANQGYHFVEWRLNGEYLSSNPTVYVDYGANTVEPIFAPDNPQYADVTIRAWSYTYGSEGYGLQIDCDGEYFGLTPIYNDQSLYIGWYTFSNSQLPCWYISVNGGQQYAWGNSIYLYLGTSPTLIDFYFY
ncbi:hypothetical protein JXA31_09575 [Candidatus Bathyarchaeota archaeon]|nr:hypothetical protein [Candidatus Bathyarchaeota archaeon]